jgi:hypothetical protein
MSWRGVAPVQLVIVVVGLVLWTSLVGIITLAVMVQPVPDELGTLAIASMTALAGLLAPNTALVSGRAGRRAEQAGQAAAAAVLEVEGLEQEHQAELDRAPGLGEPGWRGPE